MRGNRVSFRTFYFLSCLILLTGGIISCQKAEAPQPGSNPAADPPQASSPAQSSQAPQEVTSNPELVRSITDASFGEEVEKSAQPVLVDFWATWCGPCRMFGPIVDKLAEDYKGRLKVVRVDIDQNPGLARNFAIRAIPTALLFKKGRVVKGWVGLVSEEDLKVGVNEAIKKAAKKPKPIKT